MRRTLVTLVLSACCVASRTYVSDARSQCRILEDTLLMYEQSEHRPAATLDDLRLIIHESIDGFRADPWGRPYIYEPSAVPHIRSMGPDGVAHTDDDVTVETRENFSCVPG